MWERQKAGQPRAGLRAQEVGMTGTLKDKGPSSVAPGLLCARDGTHAASKCPPAESTHLEAGAPCWAQQPAVPERW